VRRVTRGAAGWAVAVAAVTIVVMPVVGIDREGELNDVTEHVHRARQLKRDENDQESRERDEATPKRVRPWACRTRYSPTAHGTEPSTPRTGYSCGALSGPGAPGVGVTTISPIIPSSACSRMWQCAIHRPGLSMYARTFTVPPGGTSTTSFRPG